MNDDSTLDPGLRCQVEVPNGSPFPIQNLPYGIFSPPGGSPRVGVAIGRQVLDLAAVHSAGLLAGLPESLFSRPHLNDFLSLGRERWRGTRHAVSSLLADGPLEPTWLFDTADVRLHLPARIGDFVDFYSSIHHATNVGSMLRPEGDPLPPSWRRIPIGYHGRSSTVVVDGTPVRRPRGMREGDAGHVTFGPSARLDFELEVGFLTGPGNPHGSPIPVEDAESHVFGIVLLNDWSARDIQAYEYRPLGPFLGKSFATSISGWVVDLDALAPFRVEGPAQDPPPESHLRGPGLGGIDIRLEVVLNGTVASRTGFAEMYWTMAQQLAHATSNGAVARPGDLWGSGTVSGPERGMEGSMLELTRGGAEPIVLDDGSTRRWLEDGDEVLLRGWCEADGAVPIGLGDCRGMVTPG